MQQSVASFTPFRDVGLVRCGFNPWAAGNRQQNLITGVKFKICYSKRRQCITAAHRLGENLAEQLLTGGRTFSTFVSQILGRQLLDSDIEKLPVFFQREGQQLQYAWDGHTLYVIPVEQKEEENFPGPQTRRRAFQLVQMIVDRIRRALYMTFVPQQVRIGYLGYMKWKSLHRLSSSVIQVLCMQAMLQAIGVGARRSLPAAAGINWVLKDGFGRLGRFAYSGLLGPTFDSNLKKVRFSTSVLFSLCLGLEMLTPIFPNYFLLLATLANIGRSIALSAYLATSSAIHKSFALGDNLADIAAKGQVQTVVADNLGLALAVAIGSLGRIDKRLEVMLPLAIFPVLTCIDLYAIYQELESVHLQTLNKARLEIIVEWWLREGHVPNTEEVSKVECRQLLQIADRKILPLRIGALNPTGWKPEDILEAFYNQAKQNFILIGEMQGLIPLFYQPGLLLWLRNGFTAKDAITGVLQAGFMGAMISSKFGSSSYKQVQPGSWTLVPVPDDQTSVQESNLCQEELDGSSGSWHSMIIESRKQAEASVDDLILAMEDNGWQTTHILLSPRERESYSTHLDIQS